MYTGTAVGAYMYYVPNAGRRTGRLEPTCIWIRRSVHANRCISLPVGKAYSYATSAATIPVSVDRWQALSISAGEGLLRMEGSVCETGRGRPSMSERKVTLPYERGVSLGLTLARRTDDGAVEVAAVVSW